MVQKLTKRHNDVGEIRLDFSTVKHFLANLSCIWKGKLSAREFEGRELPRLEVSPSYAEGTERRCGVKVAPVVMLQRLLHVPSNVRYLPCLRHSNLLLSETSQFVRLSVSSSG